MLRVALHQQPNGGYRVRGKLTTADRDRCVALGPHLPLGLQLHSVASCDNNTPGQRAPGGEEAPPPPPIELKLRLLSLKEAWEKLFSPPQQGGKAVAVKCSMELGEQCVFPWGEMNLGTCVVKYHQRETAPCEAKCDSRVVGSGFLGSSFPSHSIGEGDGGPPPEAGLECSVCLMSEDENPDAVAVLACGHWLHELCRERWFGVERTCPSCRCDC
jgi:hypothetical protein